jgi:hypothetical protein
MDEESKNKPAFPHRLYFILRRPAIFLTAGAILIFKDIAGKLSRVA